MTDRRLRILVVNLGRRGGVTQYGWLMAKALAENAEIAILRSAFAENRDRYSALGCPQLEVRTFNSVVGLLLSFLAIPRLVRIWRFAHRFAPDVIYYPGGHAWKPLLDVLLPRSAATVVTVHDPQLHAGEDSFAWRMLDWVNKRRASGYVLLNQAHREGFSARHGLDPARVVVIPHGMVDDYTAEAGDVDSIAPLTGLSLAEAGEYVLFIGRILPYKGVDTLLEAYGMLATEKAGPLVIAGSGELSGDEQDHLRALAGRPVYFLNSWLTDAQVAMLVAGARFVVLPYRSATQSGVVPLASAYGVPAIASATDGLAEQVVDRQTGWLFPPGDAAALRDLLAEAYAISDEEYEVLSAECREYARTNWGWDELSLRLVRFCESLLPG
jgi:glycosyltransferase involved in cell wall biosynthesis